MAIHKLQKLGENSSGDKAGIELPRDDLRLERLLNENGELVERPYVGVQHVDDGEWRLQLLDDDLDLEE